MCKWGDIVAMGLTIPAHLSHTGKAYKKLVGIDRCMVSIVRCLNDNDLITVASCCGHGNAPGNISLADGREIIIARSWEEARKMESVLEINIHGETKTDLVERRNHHEL